MTVRQTYKVKSGDTLSGISKQSGVSIDELAKINKISDPNKIFPGQEIDFSIPSVEHIVSSGETLSGIGKQYGVSVKDLGSINKIKDINKISIGQKLRIIGAQQEQNKKIFDYKKASISDLDSFNKSTSDVDKIITYETSKAKGVFVIEDKKDHLVKVYRDGKLFKSFPSISGQAKGKDDITKTIEENGEIVSGAGNMSTPAGIFEVKSKGIYHGEPSIQRGLPDVDKDHPHYLIPSSVHVRNTSTVNKNSSNGCTGLSADALKELTKIVTPGTKWYVLPEDNKNKFDLTGYGLGFNSGDVNKVPSYYPKTTRPIKNVKISEKLEKKPLAKNVIDHLVKNKEEIRTKLKLTSDQFDKMLPEVIGIMGRESGYGDPGIRGSIGLMKDSILEHLGVKNLSIGAFQQRFNSISEENKKNLNITKEEDLWDPYKSSEVAMAGLSDIYKYQVPRFKKKYPDLSDEQIAIAYYANPQGLEGSGELRVPYANEVLNNASNIKLEYKSGGNIMIKNNRLIKLGKKASGGPIGDPKGPGAVFTTSVDIKHPLTRINMADYLLQRGLAKNRDSLLRLSPEDFNKLIPKDSDLSFTKLPKGKTANPGSYGYYQKVPKTTSPDLIKDGKTIMKSPSAAYLNTLGYRNVKYLKGGWLGDSLSNAATGASMGSMIGPWGTAIGAVGGFVSGMFGGEDEESEVYKPAISKSRQMYDTTVAEGGMNLKRLSRRTDYEGEQHNNGGINLPIGAQVEDGESRTGDIVHSDKIKITPAIMKRYGGNVPFKKGDRGKSIADVVKSRDKIFEKRSGDEWNDQARKVAQLPFEEMSDELSQIYDVAEGISQEIMKGGGKLSKLKARKMLHDGKIHGKPITDKQRRYFGSVGYGANGGLKEFFKDPGNAPIIGSGIGMIENMIRKPEKVKYEQASFTPTAVTPISTEAGIGRIRRTFGNSREKLRKINPRGYMNNLANMSAMEAESIGDYTSQIQGQNAELSNRASMLDSQNRNRTSMFNSQIGMQEAEANAANRGMRRTAIDANMNNLFTQIGQKSRDEKMMEAQENYQNQMMKLQNRYLDIWKDSSGKGSYDFSLPGDDIFNPMNPIEDDTDKLYSKFGGSILPKTTALLGRRKYRTY